VDDKAMMLHITLQQWPLREGNVPRTCEGGRGRGVSDLHQHATHPFAMVHICNRFLSIPLACITMAELIT